MCHSMHRCSSMIFTFILPSSHDSGYIVGRPDSFNKLESSRHSGPELKRQSPLPIWKNCISASWHAKAMEKSIISVRRSQWPRTTRSTLVESYSCQGPTMPMIQSHLVGFTLSQIQCISCSIHECGRCSKSCRYRMRDSFHEGFSFSIEVVLVLAWRKLFLFLCFATW